MIGLALPMLAASTAGFCSGSLFLKRYADGGGWFDLSAALALFLLANLAYSTVIAHGLAQGAVASSMSCLALTCMIGALVFGEKFGPQQIAGLFLAIAAAWVFAYGPKVVS